MNIELLKQLLMTQSVTFNQFRMFARIIRELSSMPGLLFKVLNGNIYVTKGQSDGYPAIVAHMDTVHDIVEDLSCLGVGKNITGFNRVTMTQTGIGGDDKVGIFIALECLRAFDHLKVVFFRDEESGCFGSYEADHSFFEDCNFILQPDRNGNSDFVVEIEGISLSSQDFQDAVFPLFTEKGYKFSHGWMTDVMALKEEGVTCSVANISCGYYNPHTAQEYVNLDDVENCLGLIKGIITAYGDQRFPHIYHKPVWQFPSTTQTDPLGSLYCRDCWRPYPMASGYCQECDSYYEQLVK